MAEQKVRLTYAVGTMIEIPRGALTDDEIAQTAEFFSFGTHDLTPTTAGGTPALSIAATIPAHANS
jgi:pyruvate,orthophosphate dikinase